MPTAELVRSWIDPDLRPFADNAPHPAGLIDLDDAFSVDDRSALLAGKALRGAADPCPMGFTSLSYLPTCSYGADTLDEEDWDF